ncbi:hypothetical protein FB45DRAFT_1028036 [Roridomyces roridus]|uniref:Uncharacterized protein n=1 Tax=Roridomyces roridus TaxID=1738132 RepID=A0AAD7BUJ6_9AGAR|nr:hypothetical protein FB45DRAFT_1028036 [Roridomyces roridus]
MAGTSTSSLIYNIGLLATTDLGTLEDRWMYFDARAFQDMFSQADRKLWLSTGELDAKAFIGDERLHLANSSVVPVKSLKTTFIGELMGMAHQTTEEDVLIIVLCGVEGAGDLLVGGDRMYDPISKSDVEFALESSKVPRERTFLVSNTCYSGSWVSPKWSLYAAAGPPSAAIVATSSDQLRGSIFPYTKLGLPSATDLEAHQDSRMFFDACVFQDEFQHAHHRLWFSAAHIDAKVLVGDRHAEGLHLTSRPLFHVVPVDELKMAFIVSLSQIAGKAKEEDTLTIVLCGQGTSGDLVVDGRGFSDQLRKGEVEVALKHLKIPRERTFLIISNACYSGSWRSPKWSLHATAGARQTLATSDSNEIAFAGQGFPTEEEEPATVSLSPTETEELLSLCKAYAAVTHANVAIDVSVNTMTKEIARSKGSSFPVLDERVLLCKLRYRARDSRRVSIVADILNWATSGPVDEWTRGNGLGAMMEAEEHGAAIATEFFMGAHVGAIWGNNRRHPWKTMGPGAWLADAWKRSGRPEVDSRTWAQAVAKANADLEF